MHKQPCLSLIHISLADGCVLLGSPVDSVPLEVGGGGVESEDEGSSFFSNRDAKVDRMELLMMDSDVYKRQDIGFSDILGTHGPCFSLCTGKRHFI